MPFEPTQLIALFVALVGLFVFVPILVVRIRRREGDDLNRLKTLLEPYTDAEYFERLEREQALAAASYGERKKENIYNKSADAFGKIFLGKSYQEKLSLKLAQGGMKWKPSEFLFLKFIIFVVTMFNALLFLGSFIWMFLLGLIGWFFPNIMLAMKAKKRVRAFNDQLVDALTMMSNSMKAGYSFLQALDLVAKESHYPMNEEFGRVIRENSLGVPLDDAFEGILGRVPSEDLDLVLTVVLIQRQIGGNLSEILDKIAHVIRERIRIKGEIRALTAQGRMSGIVIAALPFALYLIMHMLEPEKMSTLYKDKIGWGLIAIGLIMQFIGIVAIKKIITIDV